MKLREKTNKRADISSHAPPYTITPEMVRLVAAIGELVGSMAAATDVVLPPQLRRRNRIRSIHGSLGIEQNSLSLDQVTAVINGRRVMGPSREIQEVRNAFAAYEALPQWSPTNLKDLLAAHRTMMAGLADDAGSFRSGGVGIFKGKQVVHLAPPARRVPALMADLLKWLKDTKEHPLVAGCVFHYEFEFVHPFADGNGRMGRLWQTLVLSTWQPWLAFVPVESIVRERQAAYYRALRRSDRQASSTRFIAFMLEALRDTLDALRRTEQETEQVTEQARRLLGTLLKAPLTTADAMRSLRLAHRPTFLYTYIKPAMEEGLIEMTQPGSPRSPTQRYRLTAKGRCLSAGLAG